MDDNQPKYQGYFPVYGDVEIKDAVHGIIMPSPNGTKYRATINNAGAWVITPL